VAAVAGFALGLIAFVTYAAAFVAVAGAIAVVIIVRNLRTTVALLGAAALAGVAALGLLWLVFGYDMRASQATIIRVGSQARPLGYWAMGTPALFFIAAGGATAALGLIGLVTRRPPMSIILLVGMLAFADLPKRITGLYPGEIERTWIFVQPFFAAAAGAALVEWERTSSLARRYALGILVALGGWSAIAIQAVYDTKR
jgi:hypothetical protein